MSPLVLEHRALAVEVVVCVAVLVIDGGGDDDGNGDVAPFADGRALRFALVLHDLRAGDAAHDVDVDDDHVSGFRSLVPAATDGFADVHWIQRPPLQSSSSSSSQTFVDRRIPPSLA